MNATRDTRQTEPSAGSADTLHLDALGGVAGDMFVAALLELFPEVWPDCRRAIEQVGFPKAGDLAFEYHCDGVLTGARFIVTVPQATKDDHDHAHWSSIRARIEGAGLPGDVRDHAVGIFTRLAHAEALVHGIAVDKVVFHEVGAWDSIADIIAAATLIHAAGFPVWTIGTLPRGSGQVETQHGMLPIPAPATMELLKGFVLTDDGEAGERVTPTGAAILSWLGPRQNAIGQSGRLAGIGTGFGTRKLVNRPNILRASLYSGSPGAATALVEPIEEIRFEIDDQTGEDLAVALDNLRNAEGVRDICQWAVSGKKGRIAIAVQVLVEPAGAEQVIERVFVETTTLGIRRRKVSRHVLDRSCVSVDDVRVKLARRPDGLSAKADIDDARHGRGVAGRREVRTSAQDRAMDTGSGDG